tara:strand:+ start:6045 stop:7163 length:1119 start_codon:yes stop_codon:yes gene_type:complete
MPVGRFFGASEVLSGSGSFSALAGINSSRVLILCSRSFIKSEKNSEIIHKTFKKFIYLIHEVPKGEPNIKEMKKTFEKIFEFKPDMIIAIGGGSAIDSAKLSWLFYEHPDLSMEQTSRNFAIPALRGKSKFIAVPTTAGSGSEMSSSAVFQFDKNDRKRFAVSHDFLPDIAVLDPNFIIELPRAVKVNGAFDALAHSIEGYISLFKNKNTQDLATIAIKKIFSNIEKYLNNSDEDAAYEILRASNYAGIVQNISIPGIGHAFSHSLASYGINHGFGCGSLLPLAMKFNSRDSSVKNLLNKLAKELNLKSHEDLISKIQTLTSNEKLIIGGKRKKSIKINENFITNILSDPTARANPVLLEKEHIIEFFEMIE